MARTRRVPGHRITWWVWGWNSEGSYKIRHNARMRGTWGWDASCSCGWESRTGGATRHSVEHLNVFSHMWDVADDAQRNRLIGLD